MRAIAILKHTEASGVGGGAATSGSWENRKLTVVTSDLNSLVSLDAATGIFTLLRQGRFIFDFNLPFLGVDAFQSRLFNVTSGAELILGETGFVSGASCMARSRVFDLPVFLDAGTQLRLQSRVQTSRASTDAYGNPASFGTEVYTTGSVTVLG